MRSLSVIVFALITYSSLALATDKIILSGNCPKGLRLDADEKCIYESKYINGVLGRKKFRIKMKFSNRLLNFCTIWQAISHL
jgi:hypothetical protein